MSDLDVSRIEEIRELAASGQILRALERYRELTGADIRAARQYVTQVLAEEPLKPEPEAKTWDELPLEAQIEIRQQVSRGDPTGAAYQFRQFAGGAAAGEDAMLKRLASDALAGAPPVPELLERAVLIHARWPDRLPAPAELLDLVERWPEEQRTAAFALACLLCRAAYDCCDMYRSGKLPGFDAVHARLVKECPGFSRKAYEMAVEAGMIDSR